MQKDRVGHRVAVVLTPDAPLFEVAVPCEIFGASRPDLMSPAYDLYLVSTVPGATVASGLLAPSAGSMDDLAYADTIIVPAFASVDAAPSGALVGALRAANARGARIVGLCSGAFALAEAGLLDGRRATTHWMYAETLASRYPLIDVDASVLYTADDNIFTSAGTAAAIDLCLELVRRDRGAAVVNELARRLVVPPHRSADQAQFVPVPVPEPTGARLGPTLEWARANLREHISLADLARHASVSRRTLIRHFEREHGMTPSRWLLLERVRRAQHLLESSEMSIDRVAAESGFGTTTSMRQVFARQLHTAPAAYRGTFRHASPAV